jgi:hypothetical protein
MFDRKIPKGTAAAKLDITSYYTGIEKNMTDFVADYSGWPACPFEKQLDDVNLGKGF